ncbi:uncharacterized protein BXZ73DRAFT_78963 [Epithele typhae]|uniref:uncharacterized protein n=1 Tax=Epithele typhae TaxID=378194 RepID=UPI0020082363|nr:uncharacterized protein BXZ73DRAFT_78963 [Epithele typhae]KAH9925624.1 hypothetical protein BXZ73DRAFT_78963 [Epithele typhae]
MAPYAARRNWVYLQKGRSRLAPQDAYNFPTVFLRHSALPSLLRQIMSCPLTKSAGELLTEVPDPIGACKFEIYDNAGGYAALAILFMEYILTLPDEITLFWIPRRFNAAFALLVFNRLITFANAGMDFLASPQAVKNDPFFRTLVLMNMFAIIAFNTLVTYTLVKAGLLRRQSSLLLLVKSTGGVIPFVGCQHVDEDNWLSNQATIE